MMTPILADAGIPMLFFHQPAMVAALIPVVAVEWLVAHRLFGVPGKNALKGVILANCYSTLLGFPLFWLIGVLGMVFIGPYVSDFSPVSQTMLGRILEFAAGMVWLGPESSTERIVPAGSAMLVPAFFVSVYSERWILCKAWPDVDPATLARLTWVAHLCSYPVLAAVWLGYVFWLESL